MIDTKELRVGNYAFNRNQIVCLVSGVTAVSATLVRINGDEIIENSPLSPNDVSPIPLTPEILDKCGFKNGRLNIDITAVRPLYLQSGCNGTVVFYWGEENNQPSPYSIHYEYLHQLQNLYFALTGEELNVEL